MSSPSQRRPHRAGGVLTEPDPARAPDGNPRRAGAEAASCAVPTQPTAQESEDSRAGTSTAVRFRRDFRFLQTLLCTHTGVQGFAEMEASLFLCLCADFRSTVAPTVYEFASLYSRFWTGFLLKDLELKIQRSTLQEIDVSQNVDIFFSRCEVGRQKGDVVLCSLLCVKLLTRRIYKVTWGCQGNLCLFENSNSHSSSVPCHVAEKKNVAA